MNIITDLDGTLLNEREKLSDVSSNILSLAIENGVRISYATARSFSSSYQITKSVKWRDPVIVYNGSAMMDPITQTVVFRYTVPKHVAYRTITIANLLDLNIFTYFMEGDGKEYLFYQLSQKNSIESSLLLNLLRYQKALSTIPNYTSIVMMSIIGTYTKIREFIKRFKKEEFGNQLQICLSRSSQQDMIFLGVMPLHVTKEKALRVWAEHVRCTMKDIIVFGDNYNDIPMFDI